MDFNNLALGAAIQLWEVSTLGQPFEVIKTQMAANRKDSLRQSLGKLWNRGQFRAFYQGLVPWAWIEAATKGSILLFTSSEVDRICTKHFGMSRASCGIAGGMIGGIMQAYTTMGFCTFMKTVEVTRAREGGKGTLQVAREIIRNNGLLAMNRGVTAVALRQMTNWGSRIGISRISETIMRKISGSESDELSTVQKLGCSVIGGSLGCWNQPIEVVRVEMQRQQSINPVSIEKKMNIVSCMRYIYARDGMKGLYRGVLPRICLSTYLTVCMVFGGDLLKEKYKMSAH